MQYRAKLVGGFNEGARLTIFHRYGDDPHIQLQAGNGIEIIEGPEEGSIITVHYVDDVSLELLIGRTLRRLRPADEREVPSSDRVNGQKVQNWIVMPN